MSSVNYCISKQELSIPCANTTCLLIATVDTVVENTLEAFNSNNAISRVRNACKILLKKIRIIFWSWKSFSSTSD